MGKDDARQGRTRILTPSELKQGIVNLGEALLPKPGFGTNLGFSNGWGGSPNSGKTILMGSGVVFGNGTYLGGYCDHVLPALSPINSNVTPSPESHRPVVEETPVPQELAVYASSRSLNESQWQEIADDLGVEVALLKAIAHAESEGSGFESSGRPKILIEPRWLRNFGIEPGFDKPTGSWEVWNNLLSKGSKLNKEKEYELALIASTSFGLFQTLGLAYLDYGTQAQPGFRWGGWILGENRRPALPLRPERLELALELLRRFKDAMMSNEYTQAKYFVNFVRGKPGLLPAMRRLEFDPVRLRPHDWCTIAFLYNGPDFEKKLQHLGGYDMALTLYYIGFSGTKIDSALKYRERFYGRPRPCGNTRGNTRNMCIG